MRLRFPPRPFGRSFARVQRLETQAACSGSVRVRGRALGAVRRPAAAMATDKPAAVEKPSVPVSTGRLIPWSTEEDELLRQVRLRLARRAWSLAQPYERPSATGAAGIRPAAAAPASAPCWRGSQPQGLEAAPAASHCGH